MAFEGTVKPGCGKKSLSHPSCRNLPMDRFSSRDHQPLVDTDEDCNNENIKQAKESAEQGYIFRGDHCMSADDIATYYIDWYKSE